MFLKPTDLKPPAIVSKNLLNLPSNAFPVPVWVLSLDTPAPTPLMAPAKPAPSSPNFNLFNNSAVAVSEFLSMAVGPPIKSPKVPAFSTSPTNIASDNPVAAEP